MPKLHYLRELLEGSAATRTSRYVHVNDSPQRYNVYDMSRAGHGHRVGWFDTADGARRFAEKITALHSQKWRLIGKGRLNLY